MKLSATTMQHSFGDLVLRAHGRDLDKEVADTMMRFDDDGRWCGDLRRLRALVSSLADYMASVRATAAVTLGPEPAAEDYNRRKAELAVMRVALMRTCLDMTPANPVLSISGLPVAILVALTAGGLARMPRDDTYESGMRPRFEGIVDSELAEAIAEVVRADGRGEDWRWCITMNQETMVVQLSPRCNWIEMQLTGADGRTPLTRQPLRAAMPGDGLCRYEYDDIDFFFGQSDE